MNKLTFNDRVSDNQNRRKIVIQSTSEDGKEIIADITRYDNNITQTGTVIDATRMNRLQDNIENEFNSIKEELATWKDIVSTHGSIISVDKNVKANINFDSDPQEQIDYLKTSINYDAIAFAEHEKQKGKNLFNIDNLQYTYMNCEFNIGEKDITITSISDGNFVFYVQNLEVGKKYTISVSCITYPSSSSGLLLSTNSQPYDETADIGVINSINNSVTFESPSTEIYIKSKIGGQDTVMKISNLQIEEGEKATDYQSYNGKLVREKELKIIQNLREHRMTLTNSSATWHKYGLTLLLPKDTMFTISLLADWLYERNITNEDTALPLYGGSAGAGSSSYPAFRIFSSDGITIIIQTCGNNTYANFSPNVIENYKIYNPFTMEFIR